MPENDKPQRLTPEQVAAQQAKWPPWLKNALTPANRRESAALQERLASVGPFSRLTAEERQMQQAASLQTYARAQLEALDFVDHPVEVTQATRILAEGLALAGDFAEAAMITPDKEAAAHYRAIMRAIDLPDDERCDCPPMQHDLDGEKVIQHHRIIRETVFSKKHNRVMPIIYCLNCGHANVTPPSARLAARAAAVQKNMQEAHGRK